MAQINLQKIVSVKGHQGLFHLLNFNPKGYFLQPFAGGAAKFFANEKGKILAIGNVDLKLKEDSINSLAIFLTLKDLTLPSLNASREEIDKFFREQFPDLADDVAPSQIEKMFRWYLLITEHYHAPQLVNDEDDGLTII